MPKKRPFHAAVAAIPSIAGAFRPGVQALKKIDRNRLENGEIATGSIALDDALLKKYPNAHRWDYGIGVPAGKNKEKVVWVEVHHAASGETDRVLRKLEWLKNWLRRDGLPLDGMQKSFVWLLSNIDSSNDRRRRDQTATKYGLRLVRGTLRLSEF